MKERICYLRVNTVYAHYNKKTINKIKKLKSIANQNNLLGFPYCLVFGAANTESISIYFNPSEAKENKQQQTIRLLHVIKYTIRQPYEWNTGPLLQIAYSYNR